MKSSFATAKEKVFFEKEKTTIFDGDSDCLDLINKTAYAQSASCKKVVSLWNEYRRKIPERFSGVSITIS